ncbi:hypothetical protein BT96DRAFT_993651 [Gymnopus androsaceus JB14]|uniref:Uncharacterized protein n=1 Tax=Gymnopus androsaceus JB14 TaxID=1447944 RepID=A0A6A4HS34_9AGAR|nr:hypothetical protein BT96DRAFT_993651 [Gymnopus androsaceus JB14]
MPTSTATDSNGIQDLICQEMMDDPLMSCFYHWVQDQSGQEHDERNKLFFQSSIVLLITQWYLQDDMVKEGQRLPLNLICNQYLPIPFIVPSDPNVSSELKPSRILVAPINGANVPYLKFFNKDEQLISKINHICDKVLGPEPTQSKTFIEDSTRAHFVGEQVARRKGLQPPRCLSLACTTEHQTGLTHPGLCAKNPDLDDSFSPLQQELNPTLIEIAVNTYKLHDPATFNLLHQVSELMNIPKIGHDQNPGWTSLQCNLATFVPKEKAGDATLAAEMGRVGDPHHDRFDNPVPCTVSVSAPRAVNNQGVMLENFEGGQFHLLDLGFQMDLTNPSVNGFSGGRLHGGTIAFGPEGADTKGCYHWLCPIYPISSTLCNTVAQTIGGMPDGRPIQLLSEHKNLPNRKQAL